MNRLELETWLRFAGVEASQQMVASVAEERRKIQDLETRIQGLRAGRDWFGEVALLRAVDLDLDQHLQRLQASLRQASAHREAQRRETAEQCLQEIEIQLLGFEEGALGDLMERSQELFDAHAADELRDTIVALSPAMLREDLQRSHFVRSLQAAITSTFEAACREVAGLDAVEQELLKRREQIGVAAAEARRLREFLLQEHGVSQEVVNSLREVRDPQRFREDVLEVHIRAAEAEASWNLQKDALEYLLNEVRYGHRA
jgi:hypothetical protein